MPAITINVANSMVAKVRGNDMSVDMTAFADLDGFASKIFEYGFNRWFNDGSAPQGKKAPKRDAYATDKEFGDAAEAFGKECLANAIATRDLAYKGEYGRVRGTAEPVDPVGKEATRLARDWVRTNLGFMRKEAWIVTPEQMVTARAMAAKYELDLSDAEKLLAHAVTIRAERDDTRAAAEKIVAETATLKPVNLDDL